MKKISIIVPVYNAEKYISDCITSILNQTYSYFELLLIDDGSTDMSGKICDDFNYKDNRIKVIHKENGGVSSARNIGIEASSGDYIIFIDSDDSINKNMVDELVSALDKYEVETIVHTIGYKRNEKSKKNEKFTLINTSLVDTMPIFIKKRYINPPWNKLYSRRIIEKNNIRFSENISLGEDALFNYHYFNCLTEFLIINDDFYNYRKDNDMSLTKVYNNKKYNMLIYVNDKLQDLVASSITYSKCNNAANYIRLKAIFSSLFDTIRNEEVSENDKDILYDNIFKTNKKFKIKEIDELSFKILAVLINSKSKALLKFGLKLVYVIYNL